MTTNFDFSTGNWAGGAGARVSRHDLIFDAPMSDPVFYGIPIGNGDIGVLFFCEKEKLVMVMNKCDLWDDVPLDDFANWKTEEEEHSTTLRHGRRRILDFGEPAFDECYLEKFRARLSRADGLVSVDAVSPFGTVSIRAFVGYDYQNEPGVLCMKVKADLAEQQNIRFSLERYGSRTFSHWYNFQVHEYAAGLAGTETFTSENRMYASHTLPCGIFACAASVMGGAFVPVRENSHRVSGLLPSGTEYTIFAGITSPVYQTRDEAYTAADAQLLSAEATGFDALYRSSAEGWEEFWSRSYVETDDDYWDNLWALDLYYANCSQRGAYPGRFIDGLWAHSRDFQAWNFYFHWNQQEVYWPLNAAGHPELCRSYLDYRFRSLDKAKRTAELYHHVTNGGAFVSNVCDRRGNNSIAELNNHTPAAEIALDFWRQYRFTQDRDFLREKALPWLLAASRFMQTLFDKGEDGLYHARCGTAYEGWILLRDCTTEIACTRAVMKAALEALEILGETVPEIPLWQDMTENMAPYLTGEEPDGNYITTTDGKTALTQAPFKGEKITSRTVVTAGYSEKHGRTLRLGEMDGIFPTAAKAPVFPCGDIGLKDRGTPVYDALVNTVRIVPLCCGWDPSAVYAARLGLGREADRIVQEQITAWAWFHNGFGHYDDGISYTDRFAHNSITLVNDGVLEKEKRPGEGWEFRHFGFECSSVIACARNETLLQSHEGIIRLFPAMKPGASARFTLHAAGGFEVSAERKDGVTLWAAVRSVYGGKLVLEKPWETTYVTKDGVSVLFDGEISTEAGDFLIFTPDEHPQFVTEPLPYKPNQSVKKHPGGGYLGRERSF
ncbi:MAG: hypothetical protein MJ175_04230 [Clostridia bacterium]|nr:hypothetical protein [Clostridia bacterium]